LTVYVARQPIFDRDSEIAGYELLYRDSALSQSAGTTSSERMCTEMVAGTLLTIGLDRLTAGRPAYVNATREFMLDGLFRLFPPRAVVIELLETVEPDAATIAACAQMVGEGYQLALDDFVYAPRFEPLLELAHIVKLDVLGQPPEAVAASASRARRFGVRLVAERVETEEVRTSCAALGFDLFQGYFFSRPETLSGRELPPGLASAIRLLNLARDPASTDRELEDAVAADATISYKLLRHASTAAMSGRNASSLGFAIRALGRDALARLAALLAVSAASAAGGHGEELVRVSLVRARFCERVAEVGGRPRDAGALFMVGLFSKIDALVRVPMAEVVERIAFAPPVREALLDGAGPYAPVLAAVAAYERGAWLEAERLAASVGVAPARMVDLYAEALVWMRERMEMLR
jgi:EAL and modified HD-GYP domain-containing signal transduction protein